MLRLALASLGLLTGCATVIPNTRILPMPPQPAGSLAIRWLGCAGFEIATAEGTLVIDPYISRPSASAAALGRLESDPLLLEPLLPKASVILVGHSHFEHLLDAPALSVQTGAPIHGSKTTCLAAAAMSGGRATCKIIAEGRTFQAGPFEVTPVASLHAVSPLVGEPFPGVIDQPPRWRYPHASDLPTGGAWIWVVRVMGLVIVHISSAALPADTAALHRAVPEGADIALVSIALREGSPGYGRRLVAELAPRVVIPHHHDPLVGPLHEALDQSAQEDLQAFVKEVSPAEVLELSPLTPRVLEPAAIRAKPRARLPDRAVGAVRGRDPAPGTQGQAGG